MADDFSLDPEKLKSWRENAELIKNTMGGTAKYAGEINTIIEDVSKASAEMSRYGKLLGIDESMKADIGAVYQSLVDMGVPAEKLLHMREKEGKALGKMTKEYRDLLDSEGKRAGLMGKMGDAAGKVTKSFEKGTKALGKQAASMGGLQLSLIGIIMKIIEVNDVTNRMNTFTAQAARQWGSFEDTTRSTAELIGKNEGLVRSITKSTGMTLDESMAYVRSLAMAGVEEKELFFHKKKGVNAATEMLAIQGLQNRSVAEQMPYVKGLVSNFGKTVHEANRFGVVVTKLTKDIPMLTMEEALQDMGGLVDQTKIFNVSLLDTLSIYNTIIRKSEIWGETIGKAPRAVQKEIAQTITGWGIGLAPGMKAALGGAMGIKGSPAEQMLGFETAFAENMGEAVKGMAKLVTQWTSALPKSERTMATRQILQEKLGFKSPEAAITMAKSFAKGEMTPEKMDALVQELAKNKKAAEDMAAAYDKNLKTIVSKGAGLLKNLVGLEQRIKNWINDNLIGPVRTLINTLEELSTTIKGTWLYKKLTEPGPRMGSIGSIAEESKLRRKWEEKIKLGGAAFPIESVLETKTRKRPGGALIKREITQALESEEMRNLIVSKMKSTELGKELFKEGELPTAWRVGGIVGRRAIAEALDPADIGKLAEMIKNDAKGEMRDFLIAQFGEAKAQALIKQYHGTGMVETKKPGAGKPTPAFRW